MKVITLTNQKGGVGKTTTSNALAAGLYGKGRRVLAVDLDPQCNLSLSCGVDMMTVKPTLYDVFKEHAAITDAITPVCIGYDLLPGGLTLAGADMDFTQTGREYLLSEALEAVADQYDFCIIDTPPTLGILSVNALTASNTVVVPMTADAFALQGLSQLYGLIQNVRKYCNKSLKIAGILLTRYDSRKVIDRTLKDQIEQAARQLQTEVFKTPIREGVAIREAAAMREDIFKEAPKSNSALDYNAFITELLEKLEVSDNEQ